MSGKHRRRRPSPERPLVFRLMGVWLRSSHRSMYDAKPIAEQQETLT